MYIKGKACVGARWLEPERREAVSYGEAPQEASSNSGAKQLRSSL